jgi:hypothetical protein
MASEDEKLNKIDWAKVMGTTKVIDAWKHVHVDVKENEAQNMPTKDVLLELMERRAELVGRKVEEQILGHALSMVGTNGPNVVFQNSWGGDKPALLFSMGDPPLPPIHQGFAYGESTTEPPLREDEEPMIITSVNE